MGRRTDWKMSDLLDVDERNPNVAEAMKMKKRGQIQEALGSAGVPGITAFGY